MLSQRHRLTSKDVRYIQKVRKIAFSDHFRVQRVDQYPNRRFHQISIYIAADKLHRATWRHYLKRRMIETVESYELGVTSGRYYKIFLSLNPKTVQIDLRGKTAGERKEWMDEMIGYFKKELPKLLGQIR